MAKHARNRCKWGQRVSKNALIIHNTCSSKLYYCFHTSNCCSIALKLYNWLYDFLLAALTFILDSINICLVDSDKLSYFCVVHSQTLFWGLQMLQKPEIEQHLGRKSSQNPCLPIPNWISLLPLQHWSFCYFSYKISWPHGILAIDRSILLGLAIIILSPDLN